MRKYLRPLNTEQKNKLQKLSCKSLSGWKEEAVRAEYIAPILEILGYEKDTCYDVKYSSETKLSKGLAKNGSKSWVLPDYYCLVWKQGFWIMEAKSAECSDPEKIPKPSVEDIGQGFSYALHPEVRAPYMVVCNGWWICLFDLDADDPTQPILEIEQSQLPQKFDELRKILGAEQITFHLKRKIIQRIDQVFAADCYPERIDEFVGAVKQAGERARPRVIGNFKVARDLKGKRSIQFTEEWLDSLSLSELAIHPLEIARTVPEIEQICDAVLAKLPQDGHEGFFLSKLCLEEDRAVNTFYYLNSLYILGKLAVTRQGHSPWAPAAIKNNGQTEITYQELYAWWAEFLLNHLKERPAFRMIWLMEGLFARIIKRLLVYTPAGRTLISDRVNLQREHIPEEVLNLALPSPAKEVLMAIDIGINSGIKKYFDDHYDPGKRTWKASLAKQKYSESIVWEQHIEEATADYFQLLSNLGSEWIDFMSIDHINKDFDQLGAGVCGVLKEFPSLLPALSGTAQSSIVNLAQLHMPHAEDCCKILELPMEPIAQAERDIRFQVLFSVDDAT